MRMRMRMRRFTRLTNAFCKKLATLKASVALHYAHYNFVRVHRTPALCACDGRWRIGSAMVSGRIDRVGTLLRRGNYESTIWDAEGKA
jgi:hypothetical protein